MIAAALVLPARAPAAGATPARILGLTPLERSILDARKAGASRVTVLAGPADAGLAAALSASRALRRAGAAPEVVPAAALDPAGLPAEGHVLVLERDVVFDPALPSLPELAALGPAESVFFADAGGAFAGVAVCSPAAARALIAAGGRGPVALSAREMPQGARVVDVGERFALPIASPEAAREARRRLLASVRKPTDGFVSRTFNRPISLTLSRGFIAVGASPNAISALGLALGLAGAWLVARGGYGGTLIGALLFQAASVVDGSDGEVAKLTHSASPHGSWIDTACDQIAALAFFAAVPVGAWRAGGGRVYLALSATTLLAAVVLYALMIRHVRRFSAHGSMVQILHDFRRAAGAPGALGRVAGLIARFSFVIRRDFFAMACLVLALVGGLRVVVWILGVSMPLAVPFLAWFSRSLARLDPPGAA